ncbi:hypothetical protein TWF506_008137 [Arthrobotrys conoides]|uniref:Uncharacterized protein n=1 Tax=Arthrobotrys conoides TaxID=74498 RepID=A0AAN8NMT0_9PEZI
MLSRISKPILRQAITHRSKPTTRVIRLIETNRTLISKLQSSFNIPQIIGQTVMAIGLYTLVILPPNTTFLLRLSDFHDIWTKSWEEEFEKARVEWMLKGIEDLAGDYIDDYVDNKKRIASEDEVD